MKTYTIVALISIAILAACAAPAVNSTPAVNPTPEDRGKALFNDTMLGGGTSGKSCNTCHPDGKGLEGTANKKEWKTPGGDFKTIEEAVNICITMALQGTALDVKSGQMKDLVSYMKTIKAKEDQAVKKKKPSMGC